MGERKQLKLAAGCGQGERRSLNLRDDEMHLISLDIDAQRSSSSVEGREGREFDCQRTWCVCVYYVTGTMMIITIII